MKRWSLYSSCSHCLLFATLESIVMNKKLCPRCEKPLCGTVLDVAGRMYHVDCFVCEKCGKKVSPDPFQIRDVSLKWICDV